MTKSLEQQIKYHEKVASNPNYVKVYDNLGNWIQAHRCADLLNKQSEALIAKDARIAELEVDLESMVAKHAQQSLKIAELEKELKSYRRDEKAKQKLNKCLGIEVQSD